MKRIYFLSFLVCMSQMVFAQTFNYTGAMQTFMVPASGINGYTATLEGAKGGTSTYARGGYGGRTVFTFGVAPGTTLNLFVGGQGVYTGSSAAGGYNGGGNSINSSASGGGGTDIRIGGTAAADRVAVAGGGGGASRNYSTTNYDRGGDGGTLTGENGFSNNNNAGIVGGFGATQTAGGIGGQYSGYLQGASGTAVNGGNGASGTLGAGGGGGYYGGGGGSYSGGGGGSSYVTASYPYSIGSSFVRGTNSTGNGSIVLTPAPPTLLVNTNSYAFGYQETGVPVVYALGISGINLTSAPMTVSISAGAFEFSFDESTWFTTTQNFPYSVPGFLGSSLYIRFTPPSSAAFSASITLSGGGAASSQVINVSGTGTPICSGMPASGTISAIPSSGTSSTSFTLNSSGITVGAGISYQWQSSPDNVAWNNVWGATNSSYTFSRLTASTYFRLVSSCSVGGSATSASTLITFALPAVCTPAFNYACSGYPMNTSIASLTGFFGTLSDPAPTTCPLNYLNNTGIASATLVSGENYTATLAVATGTSYYSSFNTQIWIDFNDDGNFTSNESVGGKALPQVSSTPPMTISVPAGANPGMHIMRIVGYYNSGTAPAYPNVLPCPTTSTNYGNARDYKVFIIARDPILSSSSASLDFDYVGTGSTSGIQVFSVTGSFLSPAAGNVTVTAPANYEVSNDGVLWGSNASIAYTGEGFNNVGIYARFHPISAIAYPDNITISGGGVIPPFSLAVTGVGAPPCSGTPSIGPASASPSSGGSSTSISLSASSITTTGLTYQWQSSIDNSFWTDIDGATTVPYTFSGLTISSYFRLVGTCPSFGSAISPSTFVSYTLPASSCTPNFANACSGNSMSTSIASLPGEAFSSISDPSTTCSTNYVNLSATQSAILYKGKTYVVSVNTSPGYYNSFDVQMWIDFNGDGAFDISESVGGTATITTPTQNVSITIPSGVPSGTYRMRIVGCYSSPAYPSLPSCPTTANSYGQARDYSVTITNYPPCSTPAAQPTSLGFSATTLTTISGSFTASSPAAENYLVVMTTTSTPPAAPVNGISYPAGVAGLGGTIVSSGPSTSFIATGLSDNTPYWFWVYSYTSSCTGATPTYRAISPLSGTTSTQACGIGGVRTVGSGGDYATIATAITAVNSLGIASGGLALELLPSYTGETYPVSIPSFLCGSEDRQLIIRPHSSNVTVKTITASTSGSMISLNGARYVTIDGRVNSSGSTPMLAFANINTSSSANTISFINDASDNSVLYTILKGSALSTAGGVVLFGTTSGPSGNDNNTIDHCDISEASGNLPYNCIYATGTAGRENSGNVISNCNISNFYIASSNGTAIAVATGNTDWTITGNRIFQTGTRALTTGTLRGIWINNTSTGNNFTISNNVIGHNAADGTGTMQITASSTGTFRAISCNGSYVTPSNIQNNTISDINFSGGTSGSLYGIETAAGSLNITGNTIGSATGTGSLSRTAISSNGSIGIRGINSTAASPGVLNISNNTIGSITLSTSSTTTGSGMYGIYAGGTATTTISNNLIGSTTTAGSIYFPTINTSGSQSNYMIYAAITNATPLPPVISDNTISNVEILGGSTSGTFFGIYFSSTSSGQIMRNTITKINSGSKYTTLSTAAALCGIAYLGSTGTANIYENDISELRLTNNTSVATNVLGILYSASLNGSIKRNKIYNLGNASTNTSTTTPPKAIGIFCYSPTTSVIIANNMISLGIGETTNTAFAGIMQGVTSATSSLIKVYHNTVHIGGTAATGSISSTCLLRGNFASTTCNTPFEIKNNIFNNTRTGGTGSHYAIANLLNGTSSTSGWPGASINYNVLNSANGNTVGYWSAARTFALWKTNSGNCDLNSFSGSAVTFTDPATGDLHINMGTTPNDMESHCSVLPGYEDDYDGDARPGPAGSANGGGAAADIGADEFDGVANDNIPPAINYSHNACGLSSDKVFTATIADPGVVATGALAPRVYYRKNAGTWFSSQGVLTSGTTLNGVWSFTVSASVMGGLAAGNTVNYYVIAQDNNGFVGSNTATSLSATNVNTVTVHPTNPNTYTVGIGGTYTVGSGGNYTTVTQAVSAYNGSCLSGAVTFKLVSPTYPSESFPITINNNTWASETNSLTIMPNTGTAATITGVASANGIFRLYNARYITIDGVNAGGSSLTLNSVYTSNYANIYLGSAGTALGCRNITLKNMNINGGSNTTTVSFGILAMSSSTTPTATTGADNDTITIEGNTIKKCYYGIYAGGTSTTSAGGLDKWVIKNNTIGPNTYSASDNIGARAIQLTNMLDVEVSGNVIQNVGTTTQSTQAVGIYFASGVNKAIVKDNSINAIVSNSSSTGAGATSGIYYGSASLNGTVIRNKIWDIRNAYVGTGGCATGMTITVGSSSMNMLIANNMISDVRSYSNTSTAYYPYGIYLLSSAGFVKVYHNTIHMNSSYAGLNAATGSACFYTNTTSNNVDLRNNIFVNTYDNTSSSTDKGWAFYTTSGNTAFSGLDYNNYYVESPNVLAYAGGDRTSLAAFQSYYGRNANSKEVAATFVSSTDLHLSGYVGNTLLVAGTPLSLTEDIDGNTRSATSPVMGAHEAVFCNSITAGTVSPDIASFCGMGTATITATGATAEQAMQWKSSTDSATWTNIPGANGSVYELPSAITTTTFYRLVNKCNISSLADSATTKVVVNPLPATITGTQILCVGATTTLNCATAGGAWESDNAGVAAINAITGVITTGTPGTATISYVLSATGCKQTVVVSVNAVPTIASVTPSSANLCVGAGVTFTAGAVTGTGALTSYNWTGPNSFSTTTAGNSKGITLSTTAESGSYSVSVTYPGNGCSSSVVTSSAITVNAAPTVASISPSPTNLCVGATLALTAGAATGVGTLTSYNWTGPNSYTTTSAAGNTSFVPASTSASGNYSVSVTYPGTGCTSAIVGTTTAVTVNALPTVAAVTASSSSLCIGAPVTFTAGAVSGAGTLASYNWSGPNSFSTTTTGNSTGFTTAATAETGNYSVTVTYPGVGCTSAIAQTSPAVTVNALPTVADITASTSNLCVGAPITFTAGAVSGPGSVVSYNWTGPNAYSTTTAVNTTGFTATGTAQSGNYSVSVTYAGTGCTSAASGTSPAVTVNALPTIATISTSSDLLCTGTALTLTSGVGDGTGVLTSYNWTGPNSYATTTGVNSAVFTTTTTAASGNYSVSVTYPGTGCTSSIAQTATAVTVNALPTITGITATPGILCEGQQLTLTGIGASGTGSLISYNWSGPSAYSSTTSGAVQTYTTPATSASGVYNASVTYAGTGCTSTQVASSVVTVNPVPAVYSVNGGGTYCTGGGGVVVGLSGSQTGINYQIYIDGATSGAPVAGTGAAFNFGSQLVAGSYTVRATNASTGCVSNMNGSTFVMISVIPAYYSVTGGGIYCEGTGGMHVGVASSDIGVSYQLYRDGVPTGSLHVGDGNPVDFGAQIPEGIYTVVANPGSACATPMTGSVTITIHPVPNAYDVSGGGTICAGDVGEHVNLSWSVLGINYQLYLGATPIGSPVAGAVSAIDLGVANAAGTYTVLATNATTGCTTAMNGGATIIVNSAPPAYNVTGGGTTCSGTGTVSVGLDNSDNNFTYQLYNGSLAVGSPVSGTGAAISFGTQNVTGVYTVMGTNTITSCTGPMAGSATVIIDPAPTPYTVTGGGNYCAGGGGFTVGVAATNVGILYQLYNGATAVGGPLAGTGASINFGTQTAAGTYSVIGINILTSCTGAMSGTATIVVNPLPDVFTVGGGGQYCSGEGGLPVSLSFSSTGISYQLYNGATQVGASIAGTGSALSFGAQVTSGTYSVLATNDATLCASDMSGAATVTENPLPTQFTVTGGGDYCSGNAGVAVGLSGSQSGINYQLYNGIPTIGGPVAGNGSAISFGLQAANGTYTVMATNTITTCAAAMTGAAAIVVNALPTTYVLSGGGHYCAGGAGTEVTLNGSDANVSYQLYRGGAVTGSPVAGTGLGITFGMQAGMGSYSVVATNTVTACASNMAGSVSVIIDPLPTPLTVTGGGAYCSGGTGVPVGMSSSHTGISYQLFNGIVPMGSAQAGTGVPINFGNQTSTGTYTVLATNSVSGCAGAMANSVAVMVNPLPTQFNVNGGGTYCENGAGVPVGLIGSVSGVSYQLYNGATAIGSPVAGTGSALAFGNQTIAGVYTVLATNDVTSCSRAMTSSANVIVNPAPNAYTVTGGGSYCSGGTGVSVGLNGSQIGITYQLYNGAVAVGSQVAGTGAPLDFGMHTTAGTYTVLGTHNGTACTKAMTGNATVIINTLPLAYTMTGGGGYCTGGSGVSVGLANSQTGVSYQLYNGATATGTAVAGTGSALSFGTQMAAGTYSVLATNSTTGCIRPMITTATVVVNPLPVVYNVTGGGGYCAGGAGSHIGVEGSQPGVNYQLYLGAAAIGAPMPGSGGGLDYGEVYVSGTYSVVATNSLTGCVAPMTGNATVVINTPPAAFAVTGGGSYCAGGSGVAIGLSGSATGVNYALYKGTTATGITLSGTGAALAFGAQTAAGTYTVRATNATSGCVTNMTGSGTISINALPDVYTVAGGGSYCPGGGGANIGLSGSALNVTYQLYMGSTAVGSPVTGTNSPLSMGVYTAVGAYSAVATNVLTGCVSNMSGMASVAQHALPVVYTVTGGGNYCSGGTGLSVGLSGSESGVSYQLYNGATAMGVFAGTGAALNFGMQTATGSFSVRATNTTTGCVRDMSGSASVVVNSLPTVFLTTGGGNYCAGGDGYTVVLNGSNTGIDYQLYRDGAALGIINAGTGSYLDFGLQTIAGFYTVKAVNAATGCMRLMAGSPEIVVHALPTVFTVTGGGNYCAGGAGVEIGLSGSANGVDYRLYNGGTPVGAMIAGNGSALTFGALPAAGTYTVQAVNGGTTCINGMAGSVTVAIDPLPTAYTVTGGGGYCSGGNGVAVGLATSDAGVNYQLYKNGIAAGTALSGTGGSLDFGMKTATGLYTIKAMNSSTSCMNNMTGSATVSINPAPASFSVTGGGSYCAGDDGIAVGLSNSEAGVNYTLYNGATVAGAAVAGTGDVLSFGLHTAGTYTVMAANSTTLCQTAMTGSANISANPLPATQVVTGGGTLCAGTGGVNIYLSGSEPNISYALYNGTEATGAAVTGTGSAISFGMHAAAGSYSVLATDMMTNCTNAMTGNATVAVNAAPAQFAMTGGGSYCAGGAGVVVALTGSESGIQYKLYKNGVATGTSVTGTGSTVAFAPQYTNGSYTAMAVNNSTSCTTAMTGAATVSVNASPSVYAVSGGGAYCAGGTGVSVMLGGSSAGVAYQLYNGSLTVGSAVPGNGGAISFGAQTAAGSYSVRATSLSTSCTAAMTGSAAVVINALPTAQEVTGGGSFCNGSTGVHVGLAASQTGVSYKLYKGTAQVGAAMTGTGGAIDFGVQTVAGTYTVSATNSSTSCWSAMSGNAVVNINALPVAQTVIGGGAYCNGGTGTDVAISGSEVGVNYQLYIGTSPIGGQMAGTGNVLSFGQQMAAGSYTVKAMNSTTACARNMTGSVAVSVNTLPTVYNVLGGGAYCAGGNGAAMYLSGSQAGVNYRVYRNSAAVGIVAGTGSALPLGMQTVEGNYTVVAENAATACTAQMTGSAAISINALPVVYTLSSGGAYCAGTEGVEVTLSNSDAGVNYRLYNGTTAVGSIMAGTGTALSFGMLTSGAYTVKATNAVTSCWSAMSGTAAVTTNALPTVYTMTGGGAYCAGGAGMAVGLSGSQTGINYVLYNGAVQVGMPKSGTGATLTFGSQQTGVYTIAAINSITGCTNNMTGAATVTNHTQPVAYDVAGGGSYCAGGNGMSVTLTGSETGVNYRLYRDAVAVGSVMTGTGSTLNFGSQTVAANYTVKATNITTGCAAMMTGAVDVSVNALPVAYTMTGGGSYCAGGAGVQVGLSASDAGIAYQLYAGTASVGDAVAGNGGALSFGTQSMAANYKVVATDMTTACTSDMSSTATIAINALPVAYTLTGSSTGYCAGGTGVELALSNSENGVSYRLYNGAATSGSDLAGVAGSSISFGFKTAEGTYSVLATNTSTGCEAVMSGMPSVVMNALPAIYAITGGGSYCADGAGVAVGLIGTQAGVNYQLYKGGTPIAAPIAGSGSGINFGILPAGGYTVRATNSATGCRSMMLGTATVVANALPEAYAVTGGGAFCSGNDGVTVGLSNSAADVTYQLYNGTTATGSGITGNGGAVNFGMQTVAGIYVVKAMNSMTACAADMAGSATVNINATPEVFTMTGGGALCAGGTGLVTGLSGSAAGVNYRLYNGTAPVGAAVAGNGGALSFPALTTAGTYSVRATNAANSCSAAMAGTSAIIVNALPAAFTVTGGGNYCSDGAGLAIGLSSSADGINYKLYTGGTAIATATGTGGIVNFGLQTAAGPYTVLATNNATGCVRNMTGSASITITPSVMPSVTLDASADAVCAGTLVTYTTTQVNGGSTPAYQWMVNGANAGTGTSSFSYIPANGDEVSVTMTSNAACLTAATAAAARTMAVTAKEMPSVTATLSGSGSVICDGSAITISAAATFGGDAPEFQWIRNGSVAAAGADFTFIPANGDVVYCRLTSNYNCLLSSLVSSASETMSVMIPMAPSVVITANPGTRISKGQSLKLTAEASNTYQPSYQWYLNGASIHNATSTTFTYSNYDDKDTVTCRVANNTPCGEYAGFNTVLINVDAVGVTDVAASAFDVRVVPNPSKGNFTISGTIEGVTNEQVTVEVANMLGQVVYKGQAAIRNGRIEAPVSLDGGLANGMYLVNLHTEGDSKIFHIVLER